MGLIHLGYVFKWRFRDLWSRDYCDTVMANGSPLQRMLNAND